MAAVSTEGCLAGGIEGLRAGYESGLDVRDVVDEVLARIERDGDPAIWIDVEPIAALRRSAVELVERDARDLPLWGVPFGVKDNIDVAGRVTTSALPGSARRAERSATAVARLVAAGGLYVGKTNLDQLATGLVGTRSPYGIPRNPLAPACIPGGSSSGSAVAVARQQVTFALGTDTAGSGRVPAAMCGVVGMKGAPGSRPLDGVQPASPTIDCISSFTTSVEDGLIVESILGGQPWPVAVGPFRVASPSGGLHEAYLLGEAGHTVVEVDLTRFHEVGDLLYSGPWLADRTAALAPLLASAPAGVNDIVRQVIAGGAAYSGVDVFDAQRRLREVTDTLNAWWADFDVLVVPTIEWAPTLVEVASDPIGTNLRLGRSTSFANLLGLVAIAVPAQSGPGGATVLGPPGHAGAVAAVAGELHGELLPVSSGRVGQHRLAVVGAHLRGQPLNHQLTDRGAELVQRTHTAARYRLYQLNGGTLERPGLDRVGDGGAEIEVEVWSLDDAALGALTASVAPPLGIGSVELADGGWVKGFICEAQGIADAVDITRHGGWRAYLAARRSTS